MDTTNAPANPEDCTPWLFGPHLWNRQASFTGSLILGAFKRFRTAGELQMQRYPRLYRHVTQLRSIFHAQRFFHVAFNAKNLLSMYHLDRLGVEMHLLWPCISLNE